MYLGCSDDESYEIHGNKIVEAFSRLTEISF